MQLEEYVKSALASEDISYKRAAIALGYGSEQSFRNKLYRKTLNLHDCIVLAYILNQNIVFRDNNNDVVFQFDFDEYLTQQDYENIQKSKDTEDFAQLRIDEIVKQYTTEQKMKLMLEMQKETEEQKQKSISDMINAGYTIIPKIHFKDFVIVGKDHDIAEKYIQNRMEEKDTRGQEIIARTMAQQIFDVAIMDLDDFQKYQ